MPVMPVAWVQIVRLMPTILEVSRELLKRARRPAAAGSSTEPGRTLEARINALEENERRQAELITTMADQLAQLTAAVTALHRQTRRLVFIQVATAVVAVVALVLALT